MSTHHRCHERFAGDDCKDVVTRDDVSTEVTTETSEITDEETGGSDGLPSSTLLMIVLLMVIAVVLVAAVAVIIVLLNRKCPRPSEQSSQLRHQRSSPYTSPLWKM